MKLFLKMRLLISFMGIQILYFSDQWIKSYGCLKFLEEVWARQACVGANEEELTTCAKNWEHEVGRRGQAGTLKGDLRRSDWQPTVVDGQPRSNQQSPLSMATNSRLLITCHSLFVQIGNSQLCPTWLLIWIFEALILPLVLNLLFQKFASGLQPTSTSLNMKNYRCSQPNLHKVGDHGASTTNATINEELQFSTICKKPMMNLYFPPSYTY